MSNLKADLAKLKKVIVELSNRPAPPPVYIPTPGPVQPRPKEFLIVRDNKGDMVKIIPVYADDR